MKCSKCNFRNTSGARFCAQCGTGLDLFDTPTENIRSAIREIERGTLLFGRYEVIEEIGSGGMGTVYRVFDRTINEMVALKIIRPEIATDKTVIERFGQELKTARKISHRNICRMFDIGEEAGVHYITMEYVTGEDLRGLIRRIGQLNVAKAIDIAKQICEGLAEAHAMGVIHRDLKPQNIMIDREGMAKIMDFGIARFIRAKGLTTTGTIIGTPEYMSPEQAEGKGIDQRSDIYSLGILLFEASTGMVPFEGETPLSVALKHKTEPPPDPRRYNAQIPPDLSGLILKCLEKEKDKRYQTVSEIISDLDLIERGISTRKKARADRKPRTDRRTASKFSMKKVLLPGGVILALGVLAFGAWYLWLRPKPPGLVVSEPEMRLNESEPAAATAETEKTDDLNREKPRANAEPQKIDAGEQGGEKVQKQEVVPEAAVNQKPSADQVKADEGKRIADEIEAGLIAALKALEKRQYEECLNQARAVLKIDPKNALAQDYVKQAREKLAEAEIGALIDQYAQALIGNDPARFYRARCTPQVYADIGAEAEAFPSLYDNLKPTVSNKKIRWTGKDRVEATFSQRLVGTSKGTGAEQELYNGTVQWNLEKQSSGWQISKIIFNL